MSITREARERRYGLRPGEYDEMLEAGGGVCWICGEPETVPDRRLAIDHDHTAHQVRGLLCTRCNQVLGRMDDDVDLLRRMADYLGRSRAVFADCCNRCPADSFDPQPPAAVIDTEGDHTQFAYQCPDGHLWARIWLTKGAAWRWTTTTHDPEEPA